MRIRLRELMGEKGVSQAQLADALGVSRSTVNAWLEGQTKQAKRIIVFPQAGQLDALCAFFEVGPAELFEQESTVTPTGKTWRDVGTPVRRRPPGRGAQGE
jgi:transcriptional regulator with XRE-family HTH domain